MDLDDIHDVDDYSEITLRKMIDRLRRSTTAEHFIYRETELDEMWRVIDIELARVVGDAAETARLSHLRATVMRAHDLVGVDGQPVAAAQELERLLPGVLPVR